MNNTYMKNSVFHFLYEYTTMYLSIPILVDT